ncbi:hypothetical protein Tco_1174697 [Tanacetum coccineum]
MAMVVRGHGGDNSPPNDDRLWEPPAINKNAKGRKKGSDAGLIKKFEDVPFCYESWDALPDKYKGTLWPTIHTYFDMKRHLSGPNAKQIEKGMEAQLLTPDTLHQTYVPKFNVTNDSALDDPDVCRSVIDHLAPHMLFSQLRKMDYDQLLVEFNIRAACKTCLSSEFRLRLKHDLRDRKKLEDKYRRQVDLLKERDAEIASLRSQLSLKEAEAMEAIRLRGKISAAEAVEAARVNELNILGERNLALEEEKTFLDEKVVALASAAAAKDNELASLTAQVAQLTKDLSNFQLSCDELSVKAVSLESQKDSLIDLILSRGMKLVVMKCLQLTKYLAVLGEAIGHAIDKGMQDGLVTGIDHGKVGRGLVDVVAYNPSVKASYVSSVNALRAVDFPFLAQLESQKDASIADIMGLLYSEGPAAKTPEANQLQPSPEQLMLPIHRLED